MTSLLIASLLVMLLPLFVASWRMSLAGLSLQGLLMGWMVLYHRPGGSAVLVLSILDLFVIRGLLVPLALRRVLSAQDRPARNDVIPPNMLSWAATAALVTLGFRCANWLHPARGDAHLQIAVAATGVLLGMFVLASQNGAFSQAVGALRVENAIALFELGNVAHQPFGFQIGQVLVFTGTALTFAFYVREIHSPGDDSEGHRSP